MKTPINLDKREIITEAKPKPAEHVLLLQMPCGAFGRHLQGALERSGARCTRIVLNGGDLMNTIGLARGKVLYRKSPAEWPSWIADFALTNGVTDVVCYGDCRFYHCAAIDVLKPMGVKIHILEEGYLRPNWITCEPDGVNGFSALSEIDIESLPATSAHPAEIELKSSFLHYIWLGFLYYLWQFVFYPVFPKYESHRDLSVTLEAMLWIRRGLTWPMRRIQSSRNSKRIHALKKPVHLVLLQLNGDSQIRVHSDFSSVWEFARYCIAEFAESCPSDDLLVFKNHPLDNGVIPLRKLIMAEAAQTGLTGRVLFVDGGNLVSLLEQAVSAISINSTACHQALRRGIPTLVLGRSVYNHPLITSRMKMREFVRTLPAKKRSDYDKLISCMIRYSQINGGFYSEQGCTILVPSLIAALRKADDNAVAPQHADMQVIEQGHRPEYAA